MTFRKKTPTKDLWIQVNEKEWTITEVMPKNGTDYTYQELHDMIGGYIEIVSSRDKKNIMVVDEEGLIKNLVENPIATEWYIKNGGIGYIVGNALICKNEHIK